VPQIPSEVTRLSDFFRTSEFVASDGMLTLTLPVAALPAGRPAKDLRLYVYTDAAQDAPKGSWFSGPAWLRTWYDLNVLANGKTTIKLQGLGDLSFVGIEAPVAPVASSPGTVQVKTRRGTQAVTVSCVPKFLLLGVGDANQQACIVGYDAGKSFLVTVKNFGDFHLNPPATINELVGWLAAARSAFGGYGLSSDSAFEVQVEAMPPDHPTWLGFVTTAHLEDRSVLHITNAPNPKNEIQGTAVHEYFHHAQSRTKEAGKTNLIDTNHAGDWVIEGLARWFEDDLFDSLNTYATKESPPPLERILERGVGVAPDEGNDSRTRAYARFAFWKMVQSKCSSFSIPQLLNVNVASDPSGVVNFRDRIASNVWQCDFGGGLGDANRAALANALLEYAFATVKNDDISVLDSNEPYFKFQTENGLEHIAPSQSCNPNPDAPCDGSIVMKWINPAGAIAFVVDAVLSPPAGATPTLWLSSESPAGGEAFLWAGDAEHLMASPSAGKWASAVEGGTVAYGEAGRVPKVLAVILNPSPTNPVTVSVRAGLVSMVSISISPASVTLAPGGTQAFTATVTGASNTAVTWSIQEGAAGGTITSGGSYTAPAAAGTYHVVATSQADPTKSATATVTTLPPPPPPPPPGTYTSTAGKTGDYLWLEVTMGNVINFSTTDGDGWRSKGADFSAATTGNDKVPITIKVGASAWSYYDYIVNVGITNTSSGVVYLTKSKDTIPLAGGSKTYSYTWDPKANPGNLSIEANILGGNPESSYRYIKGGIVTIQK
jgi:hypothetical protein